VLCSTNLVEKVKVRKERVFGNMKNIMKTSIKNLPGGIFFSSTIVQLKKSVSSYLGHFRSIFSIVLL